MVTLHNAIKYIQRIPIEFHVVVNTIPVDRNVRDVVRDLCNTNGNAPLLTILMPVKSATASTIQTNVFMTKKLIRKD